MTATATQPVNPIAPVQQDHLSITEVRRRINLIAELLRDVLQDGVHYGTIPGCGDKPTLLKPGADKICMMFRLEASYEFMPHDLPNGHREYDCICTLTHIPSGVKWGQGVGFASTMESKHRYRGSQGEPTGNPVPRAYWDARKAGDYKKAEQLLGGPGFMAKKGGGGGWEIFKKLAEKMENQDPADQINTVKKTSAKRARVDAVLTATAASDLLNQDIGEDLYDEEATTAKLVESKPVTPQANGTPKKQNDPAKLFDAFKPLGVTDADLEAYIQAPASQWDDDNFNALRAAYAEIRSGAKRAGDYFPRLKEAATADLAALRDRVWTAAKAISNSTVADNLARAHGLMNGMEAVDGCDNAPVLEALAAAMEKGGAK